MDLYQTFIKYNPQWTQMEACYIVAVLLIALVAAYGLLRGRRIVLSQAIGGMCLLIALLMIFGTTVLTRKSGDEAMWQIRLLWSWERALSGDREMLLENLMNLALLFPVGVLLPVTLHRPVNWRQGLLVGVVISAVIELGQLLWHRGLFELDDIMHNSIGCMVGCMISSWAFRKISR